MSALVKQLYTVKYDLDNSGELFVIHENMLLYAIFTKELRCD